MSIQQLRGDSVNDFDVREIFLTLWRHRVLVASVTAIAFLLAAGIILTRPVYYKATASLMIQKGEINLPDFVDVTGGEQFSNFTVQTEVKVLNSSDLALRTIESAKFGQMIGNTGAAPEDLVPAFVGSLNVMSQGSSKVIDVTFQSGNPEHAASLANAHVEEYLKYQIDTKQKEINKLRAWFHTKVGDLKKDVVEKSQAVESYRATENLPIGKGSEELFLQEISDFSTQLAPMQVRKFEIESKISALQQAQANGNIENIIALTNSPVIASLRQQQASAEMETQSLRTRYGPKHPKLAAANGALAQANKSIEQEIANTLQALETERVSIESQEKLVGAHMSDIKTESDEQRGKMIHLKTLMVERDASQKILDSFLDNYENLQSQINFSKPDAAIVSRAIAPSWPSNPSKSMMLVVAFLFSFGLSATVVFVLEMVRGGIRNYEDIRKFGLKPLGILTRLDDPVSSVSMTAGGHREAIKKIYVAAFAGMPQKSVLFTSALPHEGRTTLAYNLASYLVSLNKKVLVIDADFVKPMLTHLCKVAEGPGLMEVLNGVASASSVILQTEAGFALMRRGDMVRLSPEGMASDAFDVMMRGLKEAFDYILVDSGPVLSHAESKVLAKKVDGVIIVTDWMRTSRKNVENMVLALRDISAPIVGMILNKVDLDRYKKVTSGSDFLLARPAKA